MRPLRALSAIFLILAFLAACSDQPEPVTDSEPESQAAAPEPAQPAVPRYSAEAFYQTITNGLASSVKYSFSPDGSKLLVTSDKSGIFNAYALKYVLK